MAGESRDFLRRLRRALADWAAWKAGTGVSRVQQAGKDIAHGGRFTCACCPGKQFRGHRALNAHHLARHGGYWAGQKARVAGRKIGKAQDAARRHARGWRHAAGLLDHMGNRTDRGRSRPELRGRLTVADLRRAHHHDRDHERADKHDRRAARHRARGNEEKAAGRADRAAALRDRWPQPARPVPVMATTVRPAPADPDGHRPPPERARPAPDGRTRT